MVKKGQKITDPVVLERMKKMREKALATRRKRAEERRQLKLLTEVEKEKARRTVSKKLKRVIVSDGEEDEPIEPTPPAQPAQPVTPPTPPPSPKKKKRIAYKGITGEKELFISECGQFVNVPVKDFSKFMFRHKTNEEKIKNFKVAKPPENVHINNYYGGKPQETKPKTSLQNRLEARRRLNGESLEGVEDQVSAQQKQFQEMYAKMNW